MNRYLEICEQVLEFVPADIEAQALVRVSRKSLTRFANSFIHQNVMEDTAILTLDLSKDGRTTRSRTTTTDPVALGELVGRTISAISSSPVDQNWTGFTPPVSVVDVDHYDPATASAEPEQRAEVVAGFIDAGSGLSAAGFCDTTEDIVAVANHRGFRYVGRATSAVLDGIQQLNGASGKAHRESRSLSDLDGSAIGAEAAGIAREAVNAIDVDPGSYEVVLRPNCVATIGGFVGLYAFGGKAASEGRTQVELGSTQFDPKVSIRDDITSPHALGLPIDWEGNPKLPVDLVVNGVSSGFVHDRRTAARMNVESTGHDWEFSEWFGPAPTSLFVQGGDSSEQEMISSIERGLLVTEFNYCRILDPTTLYVTGLTRNGTFLIENGTVTRPVSNLRFTESFFGALRDGNVLGLGDDARMADSEYGPRMVHAPTMHLASWNFTGGARG